MPRKLSVIINRILCGLPVTQEELNLAKEFVSAEKRKQLREDLFLLGFFLLLFIAALWVL